MKKKNTEIKKRRRGFGALCMAVMVFFSSSGLHAQAVSWDTSVFIAINEYTTDAKVASYVGKKIEKNTSISFRHSTEGPVQFIYDVKGTLKYQTYPIWNAANTTFTYTLKSEEADLAGYNDQEILGWTISGISAGTTT